MKFTDEDKQQVLDWLVKIAQDGEAFVREQSPLLAQEIINWYFYSNLLGALFLLVMLVLSVLCFVASVKLGDHRDSEGAAVCAAFAFVVAQIGWVGVCGLIKVIAAPRVVVLDHLL